MKFLSQLKNNPSLFLIFSLGIVSLLGDITYEGARSVIAPYLATLGASAVAVGVIAGLGEFAGYVLRLASGYLTDKTGLIWTFTIMGYGLVLSIPMLGLVSSWELAAIFMIMERMGKAIRTPARDVILSHATKKVGRGLGFGIHEAMDQVGAMLGPFVFACVLFFGGSYKSGFLFLFIPWIFMILSLFWARSIARDPKMLEDDDTQKKGANSASLKLPTVFWLYILFSAATVMGFVNFQIISYHLKVKTVVSDGYIPIIYSIAMGIDAIAALLIGRLYDKIGFKVLIALPLFTMIIPFFVFINKIPLLLIGTIFWGIVMGMQETIMRAMVADLIPIQRRGFAYGVFNTAFGISFLLGSSIMGFLYTKNVLYLETFVIVMSCISIWLWTKIYNYQKDEII